MGHLASRLYFSVSLLRDGGDMNGVFCQNLSQPANWSIRELYRMRIIFFHVFVTFAAKWQALQSVPDPHLPSVCLCLDKYGAKLQVVTKVKKDIKFFLESFLLLEHVAWPPMYIPYFCLPLGSYEKFIHIHL